MEGVAGIGVILFIGLLVFLVLRELWCWYWKINETLALLKRVEEQAKAQTELLRTIASGRHQS